ncbi:MAG TPA: cytochrome c nitrite reductase small subunit [Ignavibacteriales bacterium]|nr:cytochrome c nitrite reductase small subunit [Ignavibacteriales bacterium]HOL80852.1 cytochrome c nitrite reductase small subunit [Ignavibacteriales bacterium]HOM65878.1 cytochrome c nitrite reductase small subunit [Ignavibacteriales bacterium]HPD67634.1 cytochrome c nitrite reductase small subunit [Ignavibacteriales bacterium]HPP33287.1 cytochrome c nitrite reductase small subunit [Ignavibacteriales bacterium]
MKLLKILYEKFKICFIIFSGVIVGLLSLMVYLSRAHSYLSDDPATCMNCHVMATAYSGYFHSSHRNFTTCNDCHVPHDNIFHTYYSKAKDGIRHATIFTLRAEPQVIRIKEDGKKVVQENCIRCHENLIVDAKLTQYPSSQINHHRYDFNCNHCHRETPHGKIQSLANTTAAKAPFVSSAVPEWLKKIMQ